MRSIFLVLRSECLAVTREDSTLYPVIYCFCLDCLHEAVDVDNVLPSSETHIDCKTPAPISHCRQSAYAVFSFNERIRVS